jgi:DNA-binding NtrC family response regulator
MAPSVPTILIIENHPNWREVIIPTQLEEFGVEVVGAESLKAARDALRDPSLAVIIYDLCLDEEEYTPPARDQLGLVHEAAPFTPIVVVTGKTVAGQDAFDLRDEYGVAKYFDKKDIDWDKFRETIRKILSGELRVKTAIEPDDNPSDAADRAYKQYQWAVTREPALKEAKHREVFNWLDQRRRELENQLQMSNAESLELKLIQLPDDFNTWDRYVRKGRSRYETGGSRRGRPHGGSIVEGDET